jgi:hypothetical protein
MSVGEEVTIVGGGGIERMGEGDARPDIFVGVED